MLGRLNNNRLVQGQITNPYFNTSFMKAGTIDEGVEKTSFKDVLSNVATGINQSMSAPDKLLTEAMNGNSDVDVHEITTAMAKAEMTVTLATQVTSKIIAAYEKISQISV